MLPVAASLFAAVAVLLFAWNNWIRCALLLPALLLLTACGGSPAATKAGTTTSASTSTPAPAPSSGPAPTPQPQIDFSLATSTRTVVLAPGATGVIQLSVSPLGAFSNTIALTANGQPNGVTVTFSPGSVAAPGSGMSAVSIGVSSSMAAGSYPITISAAGGGVTHSTVLTLSITSTATSGAAVSLAGCIWKQNGHSYQAVRVTLNQPSTLPLDANLYRGTTCDPSQWVDHVGFGTPVAMPATGYTWWFIHYPDQPDTSAIWKIGDQSSGCIAYATVPDC